MQLMLTPLVDYLPKKTEKGNPVIKSYLVTKRDMKISGGDIRKVGELVPEAINFPPKTVKALLGSNEMVGVVIVTPREYKKLANIET